MFRLVWNSLVTNKQFRILTIRYLVFTFFFIYPTTTQWRCNLRSKYSKKFTPTYLQYGNLCYYLTVFSCRTLVRFWLCCERLADGKMINYRTVSWIWIHYYINWIEIKKILLLFVFSICSTLIGLWSKALMLRPALSFAYFSGY